jgi:2-amino-4-hydroxy-6-hydroxymethyldihydropteridine diphosphokinase
LAIIALGANLGACEASLHMAWAAVTCELDLRGAKLSPIVRGPPMEGARGGDFANAVGCGWCTAEARQVVLVLQRIERAFARRRGCEPAAPRTLDLDLIALGSACIDLPGLMLPHPRYRRRPFVLQPLSKLVPDFVDPRTGAGIADMWPQRADPWSIT